MEKKFNSEKQFAIQYYQMKNYQKHFVFLSSTDDIVITFEKRNLFTDEKLLKIFRMEHI